MSPAYSSEDDDIFSWVGIIMYLPTMDARQRRQITEEFFHDRHMTQAQLWDHYSAFEHWAKIEVPKDKEELAALQARLKKRNSRWMHTIKREKCWTRTASYLITCLRSSSLLRGRVTGPVFLVGLRLFVINSFLSRLFQSKYFARKFLSCILLFRMFS
ncbi:hypothetical protein K7X08_037377 [Anisodus acutangulus]|uniref:Uncharacterized protein n=1 Tax=Anisodus acutangulus TaxID=402998 RepID=A0A9Q1RT75_9SOLA|nr:hypothetical protein K7X08_037377 [Anisodus acutangulus]